MTAARPGVPSGVDPARARSFGAFLIALALLLGASTARADPSGSCTLALGAARRPTDAELLRAIFTDLGPRGLPERPVDGAWEVRLCDGRASTSWRAPKLGAVTRVSLANDREVVEVPYGTQAGLVETALGVLALVERTGSMLHIVALRDVYGAEDLGSAPGPGPHPLPAIRAGKLGGVEAVLVDAPDAPWGEQYEGRASLIVLLARPHALVWAGAMHVARRSNGVFWQGPWRYAMRSDGPVVDGDGYQVRERWTFVREATGARTSREIVRTYRLAGDALEASPKDDGGPETRTSP